MKNKRAYLDISFKWLFAIIVGAFILFLAIYISVKIINTGQNTHGAKTSKEIGVLLNQLEIGFEETISTPLVIPIETKIYADCTTRGTFGEQKISVSQFGLGKWSEESMKATFYNKYIFSDNKPGKTFYIFTKPFEFPFKVADLIYITSSEQKYCFISPPSEIEIELKTLNQPNIFLDCSEIEAPITICFSGDCDIVVNYENNFVEKDGQKVYFVTDALMYAAIFSKPEDYECQVNRLMKRAEQLAILYKEKAHFVSLQDCNTNLNLGGFYSVLDSYKKSENLIKLSELAKSIQYERDISLCKLW